MKPTITFISRLAFIVVASSLTFTVAYGQMGGDATTGDDAHPTVDSPFLRPKPKAAPAAPAKMSQKDQQFLSHIAAGGAQAVQDSLVAQKQGGPAVKGVASRIVSERGRSNKELVDLANKKGLGLGVDKIKARSMGKTNFDKQWAHQMTADYQEDVKLLQKGTSSDDKDIKAWAQKTLPMVKGQLAALESIK